MRALLLSLLLPVACAQAQTSASAELPRSTAPAGARVYFIEPQDGATLRSPVTVRFGLQGMGVAPAGIAMEGTGHHHLLIDLDALPPEGQPLPNDAQHVHFGKGQTETTIQLAAGTHTLQLLLGDHLHIPHRPVVASERITITIEP